MILFNMPATHAAELRIHGSSTVGLALKDKIETFAKKNPDIFIQRQISNSGRGLIELNANEADIAMVSAPHEFFMRRITDIDWMQLSVYQVGERHAVFITHQDNPIKRITREQMRQILNGHISNWQTLGWEDAPILLVAEFATGGIRTSVEHALLNGEDIGINFMRIKSAPMIIDMVQRNPYAIGIVSEDMINKDVKHIKLDAPITQPLLLIVKGKPSPEVEKFLKYLKAQYVEIKTN